MRYWPLIGQYWSRDLNTGLWLVNVLCSLQCTADNNWIKRQTQSIANTAKRIDGLTSLSSNSMFRLKESLVPSSQKLLWFWSLKQKSTCVTFCICCKSKYGSHQAICHPTYILSGEPISGEEIISDRVQYPGLLISTCFESFECQPQSLATSKGRETDPRKKAILHIQTKFVFLWFYRNWFNICYPCDTEIQTNLKP